MSDRSFIPVLVFINRTLTDGQGVYVTPYPDHGEAILQMRGSKQAATVSINADQIDEIIRALGSARVELSKARPQS